MKKKNLNSLRLKKKYISSFKHTHVLGGYSKKCYYTMKVECKTKVCTSDAFQDCTLTYATCVTQLRLCGAF